MSGRRKKAIDCVALGNQELSSCQGSISGKNGSKVDRPFSE
jgi:hypothetical protein